MISLTLPAPGGQVTISGDTAAEVLAQAELWCSIPPACPHCGGALTLTHRKPQGFEYHGLKCSACGLETNFGVRLDDKSLYYQPVPHLVKGKMVGGWHHPPGASRPDWPGDGSYEISSTPQENSLLACSECSSAITSGVLQISTRKYGRALCHACQKGAAPL